MDFASGNFMIGKVTKSIKHTVQLYSTDMKFQWKGKEWGNAKALTKVEETFVGNFCCPWLMSLENKKEVYQEKHNKHSNELKRESFPFSKTKITTTENYFTLQFFSYI